MAVSIDALQTYINAAQTAIADGDTATARRQIALAKVTIAGLPQRATTSDGNAVDYGATVEALESALKDLGGIESGGYRSLPCEFRA